MNVFKIHSITSSSPVVGSTSTAVLSANSDRQWAKFINISDEDIDLMLGSTAVSGKGIRLTALSSSPAGASFEINRNNLYVGAVSAICASGSKTLQVNEG